MKRFTILAAVLLGAGCGKPTAKPPPAPAAQAPTMGAELSQLPAIRVAANTNDVIVTVGSRTLTRSRMEDDVNTQLAAVRDRLPPEQIDAFRAATAGRMIEQFVIQSLLLDEAIKRNVTVTPEEEQRALASLGERLKSQGRDLNEALATSSMGRERLLSELRTGLTIDKLLATSLSQGPEPTDAEVDEFTRQNVDRLQRPERLHARRVLLAVDTDAAEDVRAARRQELEDLRAAIEQGASFEDAARTHSDCPSSARGGDLGWIQRGRMGQAFDDIAFALPTGTVSAVVASPVGFEIIQVEAREEARPWPREEIVEMIKRRGRQAGVKDLVKTLLAQTPPVYAAGVSNLVPDTLLGGLN